jgi:hypothetical protein
VEKELVIGKVDGSGQRQDVVAKRKRRKNDALMVLASTTT